MVKISKKGDTAKGNRVERQFFELLNQNGFTVWKSGRRVFWFFKDGKRFPMSVNNDIHGLFDLHAKHENYPNYNFWFQIAANAWKTGEKRKLIEEFPAGDYDIVCMVRKMDRKPFDVKIRTKYADGSQEWIEYPQDYFFGRMPYIHESDYFAKGA